MKLELREVDALLEFHHKELTLYQRVGLTEMQRRTSLRIAQLEAQRERMGEKHHVYAA